MTMKEVLKYAEKKVDAVSVTNLYHELIRRKVGTATVESMAEQIRRTGRRSEHQRNPEIVVQLLNLKARDAEKEQKTTLDRYRRSKRLLDTVIGQQSQAMVMFRPVLKEVMEGRWNMNKAKNKKIQHLVSKYQDKVPDYVEGVAVSDTALEDHLNPPGEATHLGREGEPASAQCSSNPGNESSSQDNNIPQC